MTEDIDFDIDQDITDNSTIPLIQRSKEKSTNNNHGSNEVVILSDSDEEFITLNDEEEMTGTSDAQYITVNNIVVHCISINSFIDNVPENVTDEKHGDTTEQWQIRFMQERQRRNQQDKSITLNDEIVEIPENTTEELHNHFSHTSRQRRNDIQRETFFNNNNENSQNRKRNNKLDECITINDDEDECVILNECNYPKRKKLKRNKNSVELVSFNNIGKLVRLEDDVDIKCVASNNIRSKHKDVRLKVTTLNKSENLISLLSNEEYVHKNHNFDLTNNDQQVLQANDGNTTEELVTLSNNCKESVGRVEDITMTIEKYIDNVVEKCFLSEKLTKNKESMQNYKNSYEECNEKCVNNEQSNKECILNKWKENKVNAKSKECSVNLYDSELTIEEEFVQNVNNSSKLNYNCVESVVKVENISITNEICIDNKDECILNEEVIQNDTNNDEEANKNCIDNEKSNYESIENEEKDNAESNGCSVNLYNSEGFIEKEAYECELCEKKFFSRSTLERHWQKCM